MQIQNYYYHLHSVQLIEFNVKIIISGQPKRRVG